MILVMLGTSPYPFTRLLNAVGAYAESSGAIVIAQSGSTPAVKFVDCQPFFDHQDLIKLIDKAEIVISQGGYGSLSDCILCRAKTIAVPRKKELGEAMHDQDELVNAFAKRGFVIPLNDLNNLGNVIELASNVSLPKLTESELPAHISILISNWLKD